MKIAIISKANRQGGGASRVAEDLAQWLNDIGHPTHHYCARFHGPPLPFQRHLYGPEGIGRLILLTHHVTRRFGFSEPFPLEYIFQLRKQIHNYDIIHFHDLYKAISPQTLKLTSEYKPTFFTIHDYSSFTAGCLYPLTCDQYLEHCIDSNKCNMVKGNTLSDLGINHSHKHRKQLTQSKINYIFPSQYLADCARVALDTNKQFEVIPNGVSETDYYPTEKLTARHQLGLNKNNPVIVVSAHSISDIRKGTTYACEAIAKVRDLSPLVLFVGQSDTSISRRLPGIEHLFLGYIKDPKKMALVYSAADALLFCSLADNLPLTVLEAMAVGTPVIGFSTGGVPEMVAHDITGFLAAPFDTQSLADGLRSFLSGHAGQDWGRSSKIRFDREFSRVRFLHRHIELYERAL
ncbi:MAG: glycosyltransferase [Syntrophobacteraceae bacterium]